ncbi:hypothetical protein D9M69_585990 [compost metagenome]
MGEMPQRQAIGNLPAGVGDLLQQRGQPLDGSANTRVAEQRVFQAAQIESRQTLDQLRQRCFTRRAKVIVEAFECAGHQFQLEQHGVRVLLIEQ